MPDLPKYSVKVAMPTVFAHGEQSVNKDVRCLRRDYSEGKLYKGGMKIRITEWRKKREMTVEALANRAGMSKSYLSELANGKKAFNARRLQSLADALDCSPLDLLDDSSVDPDIFQHIKRLQDLSPEDRQAVIRHAESLGRRNGPID